MKKTNVSGKVFGYSLLVIFILSALLINKYENTRPIESDNELYKIVLCKKDTVIKQMSKKIDSLEKFKMKPVIIYIKPVYKKKIESLIMTKDTLQNIPNTDTTSLKKIE